MQLVTAIFLYSSYTQFYHPYYKYKDMCRGGPCARWVWRYRRRKLLLTR